MSDPVREQFLQGMAAAACTVNVVTTDGPAGRAGVTVSAMASVSADGDAPTMLVCVHHLSPAAQAIIENGCFCTNILRDDQSYISDSFAGRLKTPGGDKFACAEWTPMATGAPRVLDPLTAFDCSVISGERVGTHHVFIGQVRETFVAPAGNPLIYANRAYGSPVRISPARTYGERHGSLKVGALHTFGPYLLPAILRSVEDEIGPVDLDLHEGDQRHLLELLRAGAIDLAFLYDLELGDDIAGLHVATLSPYVLLADGDPLADLPEITIPDLVPHPMVLLEAPPSGSYFLSLFEGHGTPNIAYRAQTFEMVRGLVAHGLGYGLLATKPASSMSYDGKALTIRPLAGNPATSRMVLCSRRGAVHQGAAERFVFHCADLFGLEMD